MQPCLHSFRCYVGNLLVHMVLFLTSVLTLLLASTHSAALLVTFWFTWFYFRPLSSHWCLAYHSFRYYVGNLLVHMVLFPTSVLTLVPGLHSFRCYVGNLLVHMVLFPTSVLILLPGLHSFRYYVGNLLVYMVLFPTSVLTLLPGLHSFRCYVGNLMVQKILFLASVLILLPSLHSFLCSVGNLLVHMVLFLTSLLAFLSGLPFPLPIPLLRCNLMLQLVLFPASVLILPMLTGPLFFCAMLITS